MWNDITWVTLSFWLSQWPVSVMQIGFCHFCLVSTYIIYIFHYYILTFKWGISNIELSGIKLLLHAWLLSLSRWCWGGRRIEGGRRRDGERRRGVGYVLGLISKLILRNLYEFMQISESLRDSFCSCLSSFLIWALQESWSVSKKINPILLQNLVLRSTKALSHYKCFIFCMFSLLYSCYSAYIDITCHL